jgi:hypothetical protein
LPSSCCMDGEKTRMHREQLQVLLHLPRVLV